jgi:16S rRNA (adenine1518-N6/adenine1519-N6)-dimethyltransferase
VARLSSVPSRRRPKEPAPRKALGQHFLRDSGILADIARAVRVPPGGVVIEIGAGTGELTRALLAQGHEVIALEIEERLVAHLQKTFAGKGRLTIVHGDGRTIDLPTLAGGRPYAAAGNLPYFAANPIIRRVLETEPRATDLVFMVQREVAQRIAAKPGRLSLLGISVQVYAEATLLFDVPPEAFDPPPKVWSSVLRLEPRAESLVPPERIPAFFDLVVKTFKNPRKHLHNALERGVALPREDAAAALAANGIDPMRRPETLTIDEWLGLLGTLESRPRDA